MRLGGLQFPLVLGALDHRAVGLGRGDRRRVCDAFGVGADDRTVGRLGRGLLAPLLGLDFLLGALLFVRALEEDARLECLFDQIGAPTLRALLGHGLVVGREVALRIVGASPEDIASARLAFGHVAFPAFGALHPLNEVLLDVLAFWIAGTGNELSVGAL